MMIATIEEDREAKVELISPPLFKEGCHTISSSTTPPGRGKEGHSSD